jgi:hypothetical protein
MELDDAGSVGGGIPPTLDLGAAPSLASSIGTPQWTPLQQPVGDGIAGSLADAFGGSSAGSLRLATTEIVGAQTSGGHGDFVSRREALSAALTLDQQSAVANAELDSMRRQLQQLRAETSLGAQAQAFRTDATTSTVHSRVDQVVAQFEAAGQQTTAVAAQAQTSSAAALAQAQQAANIGTHAQDTASQAHSAGTEAIRRTELLLKKQNDEVDELRTQLSEMRKEHRESRNIVQQMHAVLQQTREQLKTSNEGMGELHKQVQGEKAKVANLEQQLEVEKDTTRKLTVSLQQVQVDTSLLAPAPIPPHTGGTTAHDPALLQLLQQQRELLAGYQEMARLQAQRNASTSGSSSGPKLQIQMKPMDPPMFTGKKDQDVDIWLHQVDDYFALTQPNDHDGVAWLVLKLQGFARDWWEAEVKSHHGHQPATIAEMKMLLKAAFSSPLRERHARAEIRNLRQGAGEDYREYASRFKSLLSRLPAGSYSDAIAMDDWIFGLNPPYGERVMALKPKTLQEAIAIMGELDIAHQFCRRDAGRSQGKAAGGNDQKTGQKGKQFGKKGGNQQQATSSSAGQNPQQSQSSAGNKQGNKQKQSQNKGKRSEGNQKDIQCYYCLGYGHKKPQCPKFSRDVKAKFNALQAVFAASGSGASSGPQQQGGKKEGPQQGN